MDDRYLFGAVVYLLIVSTMAGVLPSSFYVGLSDRDTSAADVLGSPDEDYDSLNDQINFFEKLITFLFLSVTIDSLNPLLGMFITLLNLACIIIPVVYIYDKIRGIP